MFTNFSKIPQKSLVKIRPVEVAIFQADKQRDRQSDRGTDGQTNRQTDTNGWTDRQKHTVRLTGRHVEANRHFSLPTYGKRCIVSTE
jgi:hypothetical protein